MDFNFITNIIIVVCIILILMVYFYSRYTGEITVNDIGPDLEYVSCKYVEEGETKIREECIFECESEDTEFEVINNYFREIEEGETLKVRFSINSEGEEEETYYYEPNYIYEQEEVVTRYSLPPCNNFCEKCNILVEKN